uniref:BTB domain-containing protein n=5 Tax=Aegilops tauschii subsp. strangulata TaxID=200361 RepID=A0A453LM24_AEGTS
MAAGDASSGSAPGPETAGEAEVDAGFEFAFDNEAFSDRVLRIEVVGAGRKRRREVWRGRSSLSDDGEGSTPVLRVKTIHISSVILAAKSSFFFKLFSNGMKESGQRQSTVRIADSEENALMELLRFMYNGRLAPITESTFLVDIMMAADKFDVISCIKLCGQRLIGLPMTLESAVRCLDLPCSISMAADLSEAAKKFLAKRYEKFLSTKFQDELMRIPLAGIVAILSRNLPGVASEKSVYDFVLRWADLQYPNLEQRREILSSSLLPMVPLARSMTNVILIDQPSCIINFSLKREHCSGSFPSGSMRSPPFYRAGHGFFLSAHRRMGPSNFFFLIIQKLEDKGLVGGTLDYEIEVKTTPSLEFTTLWRRTTTTGCRQGFGCRVPWPEVIPDDSPFFIDDKLHIRVHVKITPQP